MRSVLRFGGFEDVHLLMALSVVTMIPCALLFMAAQKQFIEGLDPERSKDDAGDWSRPWQALNSKAWQDL